MNEKIQELAVQCYETGPIGNDGWPEYSRLNIEKFAMLIVRECQYAIVSRTDLPKHERKLYNNVLKEHFGVEP